MDARLLGNRVDGFIRFTDAAGVEQRLRLKTIDGGTFLEYVAADGSRAPVPGNLRVSRIPTPSNTGDPSFPVPVIHDIFVMCKMSSYAVTWDNKLVFELREPPSHAVRASASVAVDDALLLRDF